VFRFPPAAVLAVVLAGCAGAGRVKPGVFVNAADTGKVPRSIGLFFPQVESGSVGREGEWPNGRTFMASEVAAVVHVRMLAGMEAGCRPAWEDLMAEKKTKERVALLGSVIHRDYSLTGMITQRVANELGRVGGKDACLIVSITRFGPSPEKLELRSLSGVVKPVPSPDPAKSWINCGVKLVVFKTPGGQILWEAGALVSEPVGGEATQESVAARCVADLMKAFPWRK